MSVAAKTQKYQKHYGHSRGNEKSVQTHQNNNEHGSKNPKISKKSMSIATKTKQVYKHIKKHMSITTNAKTNQKTNEHSI